MLRTGVGCADIGVFFARPGYLVQIALEDFYGRIDELGGHGILRQRSFQGFVMLGERSFGHAGAEYGTHAVFLHDEGVLPPLQRQGRPGAVGHIPHPFAVLPFQDLPLGIPRLAVDITGSPVIHDPAVDGPDKGPVGEDPQPGRIILPAPGHKILAVNGKAAAVHPVAGRRRAVELEVAEARHALALFEFDLRSLGLVLDDRILQEDAVESFGNLQGVEVPRAVQIIPVEIENGFGIGSAFLGVQLLDRLHDLDRNLAHGQTVAGGRGGLVLPLDHPSGIALRAFLLHRGGGGQEEAFRLDLFGIDARASPEFVGFVVEDIFTHQPVQVFHRLADFSGIRRADGRIGADTEVPFHLAGIHGIEHVHRGIVFPIVHFGKPVVAETVFLGGLVVKQGHEETDEELRIIRIVIGRAGIFRYGRVLFQILIYGLKRSRYHLQIAGQIAVQNALIC